MRIIRLENLVMSGYDRQTGKPVVEDTLEFACSNCRRLVGQGDKFCWYCGESLEIGDTIEHYAFNRKLTGAQCLEVMALQPEERLDYIKSIPEETGAPKLRKEYPRV